MIDFIGDVKEIEAWLKEHLGIDQPANTEPIPFLNVVTDPLFPTKPPLIHNTWPTQKEVWSTLHNNGSLVWAKANLTDVPCPWVLHMDGHSLHSIQINRKCADSLRRVLEHIWVEAGGTQEAIEKLHYDRYSGSYNYRPIRGGRALSMHSYGLAIDFDSEENEQHSQHHLFKEDSLIVKTFKAEGWTWGGDWSPASIDAMHFQAARV